jgi:hypothetical protein
MNCGKNAAKKTAVLGFSNAPMKPSRKMRWSEAGAGVAIAGAGRAARIA